MGSFDIAPPSFDKNTVKQIIEKLYSLNVQIKPLVSERDQNAHLKNTQEGSKDEYVLKIANLAEDKGFIEFQNAALNHINQTSENALIPTIVQNVDGEDICEWKAEGDTYQIRLLTFLKGKLFSDAPKNDELYYNLGQFMGQISTALQGFGHAEAHRSDFLWNLDNVLTHETSVEDISSDENKQMVREYFAYYKATVADKIPVLRSAVIHNDANDNNLVVDQNDNNIIAGLIDFGDMVFAKQINELAVILAYALMDADNIISTATAIIEGYCSKFKLSEDEIDVVFDLAAMRLVMSVCISSNRSKDFPDNEYLLISQAPAFDLLKRMKEYDHAFLQGTARKAAGFTASHTIDDVVSILQQTKAEDFVVDGLELQSRILCEPFSEANMADILKETGFGVSAYGGTGSSVTLGTALYLKKDTVICSPIAGEIITFKPQDDGQTQLVLSHPLKDGAVFYSSYKIDGFSHISCLKVGQKIIAGGELGKAAKDVSRVFLQILTDIKMEVVEKCDANIASILQDFYLDPNLILNFPPETYIRDDNSPEKMMQERVTLLAPSLSTSYAKKLKIVRGKGAYLYDYTGRAFIDCVNNITHVGHCNPHVVGALSKQAALLNTNSRYLSENILKFSKAILGSLPKSLDAIFFVNSGSEANELALRLAQATTGRKTMVVLDHAYHGNTGGLVNLSPYKFNGKGGKGCPEHVRVADFPDPYRGIVKGYDAEAGKAYAYSTPHSVKACVDDLIETTGEGPCAFIAESIAGVGGQVIYPDEFLKNAYDVIRASGGICIADEVQVGLGRVGTHMWAFETQNIVPDIVTIGKPIGNGHPLAAVVTTRKIASQFANGMEYFNSFGGNPVSCAVGLAVFETVKREKLQENALEVGTYLLRELEKMAPEFDLIGDVRGTGFFIGVELVKNKTTLEPATEEANFIIQGLREEGILLSTDGPLENVLKLKPPMVFSKKEADIFLRKLKAIFKKISS